MQRLLDKAQELSGVEYNIDSYADIVKAINVIQTDMNITGTTAREAASTIEGSIATMKGAWTNFVAGLMNEDADIGKLVTDLFDSIGNVAKNIAPRIQQFLPAVVEGIRSIADKIVENLPQIISFLAETIQGLLVASIKGVMEVGKILMDSMPIIIQSVMLAVKSIANTLFGGLMDSVGGFDFGMLAWEIGNKIKKGFSTATSKIVEVAKTLIGTLVDALPMALDAMGGVISVGLTLVRSIMDSIMTALTELLPELLDGIGGAIDGIVQFLAENAEIIDRYALNMLESLVDSLLQLVPTLMEKIPELLDTLLTALETYIPEALSNIFNMLKESLPEMLSNLGDMLAENIPILFNKLVDLLATHIPILLSKAMELLRQLISMLPDLVREIIEFIMNIDWAGMASHVVEAIKNIDWLGLIGDFFALLLQAVLAAIDIIGYLAQWLTAGVDGALSAVGDLFDSIGDTIKGSLDSAADSVINSAKGIADGCVKAWDGIKGKASNIWNGVKDVAGTALGNLKQNTSNVLNNMKSAWDSHGGGVKGAVSALATGVRSFYGTMLNGVNTLTGGRLGQMVNLWKHQMDKIKNFVKNGLDKVKSFFSGLKLKLPHIKLPHFKVSGSLSIVPPRIPKISVDWYKKAMNNPMLLTQPTAFGFNSDGSIRMGGEAGSEIVGGQGTIMGMIQQATASGQDGLKDTITYYMGKMLDVMGEYYPQMANQQLVLDTGATVGALKYQMYDEMQTIGKRGGRR